MIEMKSEDVTISSVRERDSENGQCWPGSLCVCYCVRMRVSVDCYSEYTMEYPGYTRLWLYTILMSVPSSSPDTLS